MVIAEEVREVRLCFFFQAEDGIRDVERSRGLGNVYKRQIEGLVVKTAGDSEISRFW